MKDQAQDELFLTGYRSLDSEHHMQMGLLDAFSRAVDTRLSRDVVDEILDRLVDYTQMHFSSEQLLMRLYQYPQFQEHQDDHDRTVEHLQDLRAACLAGDRQLSLETAGELASHLRGHIRTADRALGYFLVRLGVGPG